MRDVTEDHILNIGCLNTGLLDETLKDSLQEDFRSCVLQSTSFCLGKWSSNSTADDDVVWILWSVLSAGLVGVEVLGDGRESFHVDEEVFIVFT